MNTIRVTKQFTFETASALPNYDGDCANIHGHSYTMDVTIKGKPLTDENHPKYGMVMDFGEIKAIVKTEIVDQLDHAFVVNQNSNHANFNPADFGFGNKIIKLPYQPTVENMLADFAKRIMSKLPKHATLYSIKIRETGTAYAEWNIEDNQPL